MSVLDELYEGNIYPAEIEHNKNSQYSEIKKIYLEDSKQLQVLLNSQEKEIYEKTLESLFSLNYLSEKENFIRGFRLGAKLMLDVLKE